jgi:DNA-binding transcriptional regulator YbjK
MAKSESVDDEILQYFQHLSDLQKQAVLAIVRAFAVWQQDWWDQIHHDQQGAIDASLSEMKVGKLTSQNKILKGLSKWIQK